MYDGQAPSPLSLTHTRGLLCKHLEFPGQWDWFQGAAGPGLGSVRVSFLLWQLRRTACPPFFFLEPLRISDHLGGVPTDCDLGTVMFPRDTTRITGISCIFSVPAPGKVVRSGLGPYASQQPSISPKSWGDKLCFLALSCPALPSGHRAVHG